MEVIKNASKPEGKLCVTRECSVKAFSAILSSDCSEIYGKITHFDVFGITVDNFYYSVRVDGIEYYVPKSCLQNVSTVLPMPHLVSIEEFTLLAPAKAEPDTNLPAEIQPEDGRTRATQDGENSLDVPSIPDLSDTLPSDTDLDHSHETREISDQKTHDTHDQPLGFVANQELGENSAPLDWKHKDKPTEYIERNGPFSRHKKRIIEICLFLSDQIMAWQHRFLLVANELRLRMGSYDHLHLLGDQVGRLRWSDLYLFFAIFFLVLLLCQMYDRRFSSYYQISGENLRRMYDERVSLLQDTVLTLTKDLKDVKWESSCKMKENRELQEKIKELSGHHLSVEKQQAQTKHLEEQKSVLLEKIKQLEVEMVPLLKIKREQENTIKANAAALQEKSTTVESLTHNNKVLGTKIETYERDIELFRDVFLAVGIGSGTPFEQSHDKIKQYLVELREKQTRLEFLETQQEELANLKPQLLSLTEQNDNLKEENRRIAVDLEKAVSKKQRIEVEFSAIKTHFRETEMSLHEIISKEQHKVGQLEQQLSVLKDDSQSVPNLLSTVQALKEEVAVKDQEVLRLKEEHALESNKHFIVIRKLDRQIKQIGDERDNYRLKLLGVLRDNQESENLKLRDKDIHSDVDTVGSPPPSTPPVRTSYFRKSVMSPGRIPPPPPPPPLNVMGGYPQYPVFMPHQSSSPDGDAVPPSFNSLPGNFPPLFPGSLHMR